MVRRVTTKSVVEEAQSIGLGMGEACAVSPQDASVWWGQLWRAAFDDALSAMMIVDADCNIVAINRAMEEMTGWSEGSALGRGCWELPGFGGGECSSLEGDCRALAGKKAAGTRTARRSRVTSKREGEPCVEHLPLHASTQATGYRLVTASEAGSCQARKRAESDIIAAASHELLSPLNLIGGYATTLLELDSALSEEQRKQYLQGIQSGTARAVRLVRNFLDVYRLEGGRMNLALELTDVGQLLDDVVAEMQLQTTTHSIRLNMPDSVPAVWVDPPKIERVITNLLVNAVKYSSRGGEIEVSLELSVPGRDMSEGDMAGCPGLSCVAVSVRDRGVGIPEGELEKVFHKFYQVDNGLTHTMSGVGLGLYICRVIVEAHGGRIWAESRAGGGSCFTFTLPA